MLRQLIASQVREHSPTALATIRSDVDRQIRAVDERLISHETAIREIQLHQATDAAKTDRMEQMLITLTQRLVPADFQRGEPDSGAAPRQ